MLELDHFYVIRKTDKAHETWGCEDGVIENFVFYPFICYPQSCQKRFLELLNLPLKITVHFLSEISPEKTKFSVIRMVAKKHLIFTNIKFKPPSVKQISNPHFAVVT